MVVHMSMYFHLKLVIYLEYIKLLRMLLPNYRKINIKCIITEDQTIEATNRQVNHKSMCIYVGGLIKGVVLGVT